MVAMHFRKKSNLSNGGEDEHRLSDVKVSKEDAARLKIRTASVYDPILDAVNEAQPFEQAADTFHDNMNRQSYFSTDGGNVLRDVFGQPITTPDISNPTRARDERPLDTIRSFEYAVSGDPSWAQQLETATYGFRPRPDFPLLNPYANNASASQAYNEQAVYQPPVHEVGEKKKKKRGLFGRKKKSKD